MSEENHQKIIKVCDLASVGLGVIITQSRDCVTICSDNCWVWEIKNSSQSKYLLHWFQHKESSAWTRARRLGDDLELVF